jgi:DNA-binding ferritin-like protein (Dps family)
MDYDDPRIKELKDYLYSKKLGVWTVKDILHKVMEIFEDDNTHRQK